MKMIKTGVKYLSQMVSCNPAIHSFFFATNNPNKGAKVMQKKNSPGTVTLVTSQILVEIKMEN
jgi:hypothetical protein